MPDPLIHVDLDTSSPGAAGGALAGALARDGAAWVSSSVLPAGLTDSAMGAARAFFALRQEEKLAVRGPERGFWRGYQGVLRSEALERFEVGPVGAPADGYELSPRFAAMDNGNVWPARPDGFREACTACYRALAGVAATVMSALAASLGLDAAFLPYWTTRQFSSLVLNNYPPGEPGEAALGGQRDRLVSHTDHGGVTLLALDGRPGLEVRVPGRGWCPVSDGGRLLLLAGESLQQWSGGRIPATVHRVTGAAGPDPRTTLVFFHNPSPDAPVGRAPGDGGPGVAGDLFIEKEMAYQASLAAGRTGNTFERPKAGA